MNEFPIKRAFIEETFPIKEVSLRGRRTFRLYTSGGQEDLWHPQEL